MFVCPNNGMAAGVRDFNLIFFVLLFYFLLFTCAQLLMHTIAHWGVVQTLQIYPVQVT